MAGGAAISFDELPRIANAGRAISGYDRLMSSTLVACPFCRELYERTEAEVCPVCGVVLRPLHDLPPSFESLEQQAAAWEQTSPDDRPLPPLHWRRGRAALLSCSLAGLGMFFTPWLVLSKPDIITLSGFDLAGARGFWFAGGAVAWFINLPLVISRRTVNQMRGARLVVTLFASLTGFQAVLLWLLAPTESLVPLSYHWGWGFYSSAGISLIGAALGLRFGGAPSEAEPREALVANPSGGEEAPTRPTLH